MSIKSKVVVKTRISESRYNDINVKFKRELKKTVFPKSIKLGYHIKKDNHDDDDVVSVVFYLTTKQSSFMTEDLLTKESIGYIQTYVSENENNIHINWLSVQSGHKRKGYATFLMYITALYAESLNITEITLDDSTGNANTKNNIYIKCGFQYSNDIDFSEMTGNTKVILNNVSKNKASMKN